MSTAERRSKLPALVRRVGVRVAGLVLTGRLGGETMWSLRRRNAQQVGRELLSFGTVALVAAYVLFVMPPGVRAFMRTVLLLLIFFATAPFVVQFVGAKIAVNVEYPGSPFFTIREWLADLREPS